MIEIGVLILLVIAFATLEITLIFLLNKHFNDIKEFNKGMEENYKILNELTDKKLESIKYEIKELMELKEYFKEKQIKEREDKEEKKPVKPIKMEYDNEIKRLEPINPKELEHLYRNSQSVYDRKKQDFDKQLDKSKREPFINPKDEKSEYIINRNYKTHIEKRKNSSESKENNNTSNKEK